MPADQAPQDVQDLSEEEIQRWIGREIDGRYRILRVLGAGGMGAVFFAEHLKLKKEVAFKIIRREFAEKDVFAARFTREAMATAQLENPHIVSATDYGLLPEGGAYLVLQLVQGHSLGDVLRENGALAWPQACLLGAQIADAMVTAHAKGIVHRDLKHDNILVELRTSGRLHAHVLDFGLARIVAGEADEKGIGAQALTSKGTLVGTPGYMAPEQITGGLIDARTDLYSLGVILFECLTGRPLWRAGSFTELFSKQLQHDAPSLGEQGVDAPRELIELVDKLLARDPASRPSSAEPVRQSLEILAFQGSADRRSPTAGAPSPATPQPVQADPMQPLKQVGLLMFGIFGFLALIAALALSLRGRDDEAPKAEQAASSSSEAPKASGERSFAASLTAPKLPKELAKALEVLATSDKRSERTDAAEKILAHDGPTPLHADLAARLELAKGCEAKKLRVAEFGLLGDPRGLPALERLAAVPRDACNGDDCYGCLRDELAAVMKSLAARG